MFDGNLKQQELLDDVLQTADEKQLNPEEMVSSWVNDIGDF
jgi:hypothetical protein